MITVHDLCEDWCARYGTNTLPPGVTIGGIWLDFRIEFAESAALELSIASTFAALGVIVIQEGGTPVPGSTADVPRPLTNPQADWMFYETIAPSFSRTATQVTASTFDFPRQVRAKRKVEDVGAGVYWSLEGNRNQDLMTGVVTTSTLLLLP